MGLDILELKGKREQDACPFLFTALPIYGTIIVSNVWNKLTKGVRPALWLALEG